MVTATEVSCVVRKSLQNATMEMSVGGLQVDNQLQGAQHPVCVVATPGSFLADWNYFGVLADVDWSSGLMTYDSIVMHLQETDVLLDDVFARRILHCLQSILLPPRLFRSILLPTNLSPRNRHAQQTPFVLCVLRSKIIFGRDFIHARCIFSSFAKPIRNAKRKSSVSSLFFTCAPFACVEQARCKISYRKMSQFAQKNTTKKPTRASPRCSRKLARLGLSVAFFCFLSRDAAVCPDSSRAALFPCGALSLRLLVRSASAGGRDFSHGRVDCDISLRRRGKSGICEQHGLGVGGRGLFKF